MNTKMTGRWGETLAAAYLKKKGFRILAMGYSTRLGEIDIIAENAGFLVFAEVKLRKDESHGLAREFVGARKQQRIIAAAKLWLAANESEKQPRFDVVEIYAPLGTDTREPLINHIENAFEEY